MNSPLPDVCVTPLEVALAPHEPALAPATSRAWSGTLWSRKPFLVRAIVHRKGHTMFVARQENTDADDITEAPLLSLAAKDESAIERAIRKGQFWRCLYFDRDGARVEAADNWHRSLQITPRGQARWSGGARANFRWAGQTRDKLPLQWRLSTSDAQIEREIAAMLADPDSDCAFAWRWTSLDEAEQFEMLCRPRQGTRAELEALLRAALWSDASWETSSEWAWKLDLLRSADEWAPDFRLSLGLCRLTKDGEILEPGDRLDALFYVIWRYCGLEFDPATWPRGAVRQVWAERMVTWKLPVPAPAPQEGRDGAILLREWLRDKVSARELTRLMEGEGAGQFTPDLCVPNAELPLDMALAPAETECAPAGWRVPGAGAHYLVRVVETITEKSVFVARREGVATAPLLILRGAKVDHSVKDEATMTRALDEPRVMRALHFDARGKLAPPSKEAGTLLFYPQSHHAGTLYPGRFGWDRREKFGSDVDAFEWPGRALGAEFQSWWMRAPAPKIEREIAAMLADPDSDCNFARQWRGLNQRAMLEQLISVRGASFAEIEKLLRAALWSNADWDGNYPVSWMLTFTANFENYTAELTSLTLGAHSQPHTSNPRLRRIMDLIAAYYRFECNAATRHRTAVRERWESVNQISIFVTAHGPSQHNRVEALLDLRDFLRVALSPAEFADWLAKNG